ncbi:hypothetical protein N8996_06145 [Candidatus Poseidonia alphae]|nr:hypothetical protein [Candidatus Poseidonia alphae]
MEAVGYQLSSTAPICFHGLRFDSSGRSGICCDTLVVEKELSHLNTSCFWNGQGGMKNMSKCGCGRSPTGMCKGWHGLSEEEYEKKLLEHKEETKEESS